MKTKMLMVVLVVGFLCVSNVFAGILPAREEVVIREVAKKRGLTQDQTHLLLVIRKIENGRPGLEFGVGDGIPKHPARRYAGNFEKSLRLQAEWAAGTIKKRHKGNLEKFSQRYCRENWKVWLKNATHYLVQLETKKVAKNQA